MDYGWVLYESWDGLQIGHRWVWHMSHMNQKWVTYGSQDRLWITYKSQVALRCVHICTRTQTRQVEARHTRTYVLIATRGKMLSFAESVNDSLWSTDSRRIAFIRPQTNQRQFSSPGLHVYIATHASSRPASRAFLF